MFSIDAVTLPSIISTTFESTAIFAFLQLEPKPCAFAYPKERLIVFFKCSVA